MRYLAFCRPAPRASGSRLLTAQIFKAGLLVTVGFGRLEIWILYEIQQIFGPSQTYGAFEDGLERPLAAIDDAAAAVMPESGRFSEHMFYHIDDYCPCPGQN